MPTTDAPMEAGIMISDHTRAREFASDTGGKIPEGAGAGVMIGGALGGIVAAATTTVAGVIITGGIAPAKSWSASRRVTKTAARMPKRARLRPRPQGTFLVRLVNDHHPSRSSL